MSLQFVWSSGARKHVDAKCRHDVQPSVQLPSASGVENKKICIILLRLWTSVTLTLHLLNWKLSALCLLASCGKFTLILVLWTFFSWVRSAYWQTGGRIWCIMWLIGQLHEKCWSYPPSLGKQECMTLEWISFSSGVGAKLCCVLWSLIGQWFFWCWQWLVGCVLCNLLIGWGPSLRM